MYMHKGMYTYMDTYMYIYIYVHTHGMCLYVYIFMYVEICNYDYTYMYILHIYTLAYSFFKESGSTFSLNVLGALTTKVRLSCAARIEVESFSPSPARLAEMMENPVGDDDTDPGNPNRTSRN